MIQLDLSDEERRDLLQLLEDVLSDLRMEIADTDSMDFRDKLKRRKEVIGKVIGALKDVPGGS
ncbi:MAG: hypothetical protein PVI01_09420 [Gemmatimonadales bacterium]|jgi:hypothetical protein